MENLNSETNPVSASSHTFWMLWIGQLISILGSEIVGFAAVWYITGLTQNAQIISLSYILMFAPRLLFTPLAGYLTDRYNRKNIMIIADLTQAFFTLVMIGFLKYVPIGIFGIISLNALRSFGSVFHGNALQAAVPQITPKEKLGQINGLKFLTQTGVQILGSVIAAWFIDQFLFENILWIDIITWIFALGSLLLIKIPTIKRENIEKPQNIQGAWRSFKSDFKEGFAIIKSIPILITLIATSIIINFLISPVNVLLTLFVRFEHGGSAFTYAIGGIIVQSGMIIGAILSSIKKEWKRGSIWYTLGLGIIFAVFIAMKFLPTGAFGLMFGFFFLGFFMIPIINTIYLTYLQITAPKEAHGRIMSIDSTISSLGTPVGYYLSGLLGDVIGIGNTFFLSGVIGMVLVIILGITGQFKALKIINDPKETESEKIDGQLAEPTEILIEG